MPYARQCPDDLGVPGGYGERKASRASCQDLPSLPISQRLNLGSFLDFSLVLVVTPATQVQSPKYPQIFNWIFYGLDCKQTSFIDSQSWN